MVLSATPIIPQNTSDVKQKTQNIAKSATFDTEKTAPTAATTVPVKFCASFDAAPHANEWTVLRMTMQWIGEELITLDGDIFSQLSEDEKAKELVFAKLDDRRVRVVISQPLLQAIPNRSTYNRIKHHGEIRFVNGREFTFRAHTQKDGQRVVQERNGKGWKLFGSIASDGTVTPTIKASLQKDADKELPPLAATEATRPRHLFRYRQASPTRHRQKPRRHRPTLLRIQRHHHIQDPQIFCVVVAQCRSRYREYLYQSLAGAFLI